MKKISVIVPVYKVEKYLHRCVNSIINQTYKNLEIILVDDGSPDNCPLICDEYANQDNRIKVIHKKNGGLSEARNFGLDIATGDYIGFVDSDDYIANDMYEILINELEKNDSDIAICKFKKFSDNEEEQQSESDNVKNKILSNKQALEAMYNKDGIDFVIAWNKLYKKSLFNDVRYPVGKIHEDEFITYRLLYKSKKINYINKKLYYYYQREDSIMGSKITKRNLDGLRALEEREKFLIENKLNDLVPYNRRAMYLKCLSLYTKFRIQKDKETYLMLKRRMDDLYKYIKIDKKIGFLKKVKYIVVHYVPEIYLIICR